MSFQAIKYLPDLDENKRSVVCPIIRKIIRRQTPSDVSPTACALANLPLADQTLRKTHYFVGIFLCDTERLPFY